MSILRNYFSNPRFPERKRGFHLQGRSDMLCKRSCGNLSIGNRNPSECLQSVMKSNEESKYSIVSHGYSNEEKAKEIKTDFIGLETVYPFSCRTQFRLLNSLPTTSVLTRRTNPNSRGQSWTVTVESIESVFHW